MSNLKNIQSIIANKNLALIASVVVIIILLGIFLVDSILTRLKPVSIDTITPPEGSTLTTVRGELVNIVFNKKLNNKEKEDIKVSVTPQAEFNKVWKNNRTLILENSNAATTLLLNMPYEFKIEYQNKTLKALRITTGEYSALSREQQLDRFAEGQAALHENELQIINSRPWVSSLPLKEKDYVVFWSDTEKKVYAQLYIKTGKLDSKDKIDQRKQEIIEKLKMIGVDTTKETIEYQELNI